MGGAPLPFLLYQTSSAKTELVGAVIEMAETGTYTEALLIRATQSTGQASSSSIPYAGSYTLSGTAITFKDNNGGQSPGSWSGDTLTTGGNGYGLAEVFTRH